MDKVTCFDRFHGCVRFSRVPDHEDTASGSYFISNMTVCQPLVATALSNTFQVLFETSPARTTGKARIDFGLGWDGGDVTVTGVDARGAVISEVISARSGIPVAGSKEFKNITSASKGRVGHNTALASIQLFIRSELPRKHRLAFGTRVGMWPGLVGSRLTLDSPTIAMHPSPAAPKTAPKWASSMVARVS